MTRARFASGLAAAVLLAALASVLTVGCSSAPVDVEYDWDGAYDFAAFDSAALPAGGAPAARVRHSFSNSSRAAATPAPAPPISRAPPALSRASAACRAATSR